MLTIAGAYQLINYYLDSSNYTIAFLKEDSFPYLIKYYYNGKKKIFEGYFFDELAIKSFNAKSSKFNEIFNGIFVGTNFNYIEDGMFTIQHDSYNSFKRICYPFNGYIITTLTDIIECYLFKTIILELDYAVPLILVFAKIYPGMYVSTIINPLTGKEVVFKDKQLQNKLLAFKTDFTKNIASINNKQNSVCLTSILI